MRVRWIAPGALVVAVVAWGLRDDRLPAAIASWGTSACGDSASIAWEPAAPRLGALFRVVVSGVPDESSLAGVVAGELLHFTRDGDGAASSLAPLPIDGPREVAIVVRCTVANRGDSLAVTLTAGTGEYTIESLRVAPAFGRAPDSALLARTRRESQRALAVAEQAHVTPRLWREPFVVPRAARVTSGFGHGREFNGSITSRHMGTDFAGATGAPVVAANRGVVRIVDAFYYGGNVVYVDHGAGLTSAYLHLSEQLVAAGDTVERGQAIGRVGATGRVTGPHLHLIVRYGSVTVDPLSLFEVAGDSASRGAPARDR
jgi:murein DD-endopeptidase MepM/ murein hydrolase activator NlpD